MHHQVSTPRQRGCRPLPHRAEPFLGSPATMGGAHRQVSKAWMEEGAGRRHTTRSQFRTPSRWWEARTSMRPHLDGEGGCQPPPHRARAIPGLTRDGGRHTPTKRPLLDGGGAGHRHTARSRFWTRPRWWEACTGKASASTGSLPSLTRGREGPQWSENDQREQHRGEGAHGHAAPPPASHGQTARTIPMLVPYTCMHKTSMRPHRWLVHSQTTCP
jgi:hypothetical protein